MTGKARKKATRLNPQDRKKEILKIARKILSEVGHDSFMPTDVARRCKVSSGTIYRYFPTKHDLLVAIVADWLDEIVHFDVDKKSKKDTYSKLLSLIKYHMELIKREPNIAKFIFMVVRMDKSYKQAGLYSGIVKYASLITEVIQEGIDAGTFRGNIPLPVVRRMILGSIEHQTYAYLREDREFPGDDIARHIADCFYFALATSPPVKTDLVSEALNKADSAIKDLNENLVSIKKIVGILR